MFKKKELNLISKLHTSTKRNYIERMINDKVYCMKVAKRYSKDYWDGDRKYGYGGYKYIKDRWKNVAIKMIKKFKLSNKSKILDIGCGKGFLLYEIKKILPLINIKGIDISKYGKKHSKQEIKDYISIYDIRKKLPFKNGEFDFVYSINTLHNLEIDKLKLAINEINRLSKKSYICVESYRNEYELFNLQCWALTCESFFSKREWIWIFKEQKFSGNYEFIYFK